MNKHEVLREFFIRSEGSQNKINFFLGDNPKSKDEEYSDRLKLYEDIISNFALPDMTRHGNNSNTREKLKDDGTIKELAIKINDLLTKSDIEDKEFENWHECACNYIKNNKQCKFSYGQAQKLVNMSLKYIYCLEDFNTKINVTAWHMTLDSYTLNWIARHLYKPTERGNQTINTKDLAKELSECFSSSEDGFKEKSEDAIEKIEEKIKTSSKFVANVKWNNLDANGYKFLQKKIKEFLDTDPPFIAEFYIWPQMQIELIETNIQKDMKTLTKYTEVISHLSVESDNATHIHINDIEKKIDGFFANLKDSL